MPRQLHSPPRHHTYHTEDGVKRRSGPGVDAQEATREYLVSFNMSLYCHSSYNQSTKTLVCWSRYLRLLAEQRARRRKEREPGYQPNQSSSQAAEEEDETAAFEARSAAAALAYERDARVKRESKLMFNTARVWVDIIVEQAVFESEQRARAAARLQARVRGDQQRDESKRMRRAIVKVQAAARARQVCAWARARVLASARVWCVALSLSHSFLHTRLICSGGEQARSVLSMLQGSKLRQERELAERNRQREENRERSEEERLLRLQAEASVRAEAGQQQRSLKQNRAVAEELICMACDNDAGPLAQLLRCVCRALQSPIHFFIYN